MKRLCVIGLLAVALPIAACASTPDETATDGATETEPSEAAQPETAQPETAQPEVAQADATVVDVAVDSGSFQTLTAAIQAAGLEETLQGAGPFTVFAPTDEAFAALPEGTVEELLLPENRDRLVQILTYHVVPGAVASSDILPGEVATVEGTSVNLVVQDGTVQVNEATVIQADVPASNGVIHVIDSVLIPAE
ncbi:fasciclin domain-containing protein [filamentous cyanobacterium LEGE 07170]|nr:fasciclin domain-containing protein [filamentous cyanobacterium LEGE 07170]